MSNDNHSKVRFQDPNGDDVVIVDIATGQVEINTPDKLNDAAMLFWHAVERLWGQAQDIKVFRDLVFKAGAPGDGKAGDIKLIPANGARARAEKDGGDIKVYLDMVREQTRVEGHES